MLLSISRCYRRSFKLVRCLCAPASSSLVVSLKGPILNLSFLHWCWGLIRAAWVNHTNPVLLWWIHFHPSNWMGALLAKVSFSCWNCVGNSLNSWLESLPSHHTDKLTEGWAGLAKNLVQMWIWPLFGWESPGYVSQSRCIYNYRCCNNLDLEVVPQTQEDASLTQCNHRLLLGSALEMPSILLYHLVGTLAKCQADASKFITIHHFMTLGPHLYVKALLCIVLRPP